MENELIDWAKKELGGDIVVEKEATGDQNVVYKLQSSEGIYFLKIGSGLNKEVERLQWLEGKQPVPKVRAFINKGDIDGLLLSAVEGTNLKNVCHELGVEKTIDILVSALQKLHETNIENCPFGTKGEGRVLVHGDACLPNFIVKNGELAGYIDLEDMRMDSSDVDLAAGVWSLRYNLGPGHGIPFLAKYGIESPTEELEERLHAQYEQMQEEWGLQ